MSKYNIDIILNENGTVNALQTMTRYSSVYSQLSQRNRTELDNMIGFDRNEMILPREGEELNSLFNSVKPIGFNVEPEYNERLTDVEREQTKLKSAGEGWLQKLKSEIISPLVSDDIFANMMSNLTDLIAYNYDKTSFFENMLMVNGYHVLQKQQALSNPVGAYQ